MTVKPEVLLEEDVREAILILEQFYIKSKKDIFNPSNWFTDNEIEQARNYDRAVFDNTRSNQIVFEDVSFIENSSYTLVTLVLRGSQDYYSVERC